MSGGFRFFPERRKIKMIRKLRHNVREKQTIMITTAMKAISDEKQSAFPVSDCKGEE